jgi:glycosyltransferase involved in cell wall biosynthesis
MNIGIIIGRFGDIDGVSLETQKWIDVLLRLKHRIFILTGTLVPNEKNKSLDCTILPALSFFSPECEWEQKRAFFLPDDDPDQLIDHLERTSTDIAMRIFKWMLEKDINLLISENANALPSHLSMGMAIHNVIKISNTPVITHDHDYFWERGDRYKTPFQEIRDIIEEAFPLKYPYVKHAVINTDAKETLDRQYHLDSVVVHNVMDFNKPYGLMDDYNNDFFNMLGFSKDTILLSQVTRIVERKGIEVAIKLVDKLKDDKVKLLITGSKADDNRFGYYKELVEMIKRLNLEDKVIFGARRIQHYRSTSKSSKKVYSLSDTYANSTACTYFSTYEGFGNAFIECVLAKKPIFVNNYKPVYWPDIGSKGFKAIMLEDNNLTDELVEEIRKIIHNPKKCKEIAEHNYKLGKKYFSYEVLEELLNELIFSAV